MQAYFDDFSRRSKKFSKTLDSAGKVCYTTKANKEERIPFSPRVETKRRSIFVDPLRVRVCVRDSFSHIFYFRRCFPIKNNNNSKDMPINENIGFADSKNVRVIGEDGEQRGVFKFADALDMAYDQGLDLVLFAAQSDPPVCRIMDYGKYRFDRNKKEKEARKKQQIVETKEIQLSVKIDTNDFNTKVNNARKFLQRGDKVKVVVRFKGRQMTHQQLGQDLLTRFQEACADVGVVEKPPKLEGRFLSMFLAPPKQPANK